MAQVFLFAQWALLVSAVLESHQATTWALMRGEPRQKKPLVKGHNGTEPGPTLIGFTSLHHEEPGTLAEPKSSAGPDQSSQQGLAS